VRLYSGDCPILGDLCKEEAENEEEEEEEEEEEVEQKLGFGKKLN
jgi:hypothetical protein